MVSAFWCFLGVAECTHLVSWVPAGLPLGSLRKDLSVPADRVKGVTHPPSLRSARGAGICTQPGSAWKQGVRGLWCCGQVLMVPHCGGWRGWTGPRWVLRNSRCWCFGLVSRAVGVALECRTLGGAGLFWIVCRRSNTG